MDRSINKSNSPRSILDFDDGVLYHPPSPRDDHDGKSYNTKQHQVKNQQQQQQQQKQQYDIIHHLEKLDTSSNESMAEMAIECIYIILSKENNASSKSALLVDTKAKSYGYSKEYMKTIRMMKDDGSCSNEEKKDELHLVSFENDDHDGDRAEEEYHYFHIVASIVNAMKRRQKRHPYLHSSLSSKFYSVALSCLTHCFQLLGGGETTNGKNSIRITCRNKGGRSSKKSCSLLLRQFITIGGIELVVDNIMKSYPSNLEIQSNSFDLLMILIQSYNHRDDYDRDDGNVTPNNHTTTFMDGDCCDIDVDTYNNDRSNNNNNNNTTNMENLFLGIVQAMMDMKYRHHSISNNEQPQPKHYSKACNVIADLLLEKPYYRPYIIKIVEQITSSVVEYMKQIEQQQQQQQPTAVVVKQQEEPVSMSTTTTLSTIDEDEASSSSVTKEKQIQQQKQQENIIEQQRKQCIQKLSVCHDILDITIRATVYVI